MVFSEPAFLFLFLPATLLAYFISPRPARNWVLCVASLLFYGLGEPRFVPILVGSVLFNYWIAIGIDGWRGTAAAKWLLGLGLASDLALLLYFKYANWFVVSVDSLMSAAGLSSHLQLGAIVLPLGISFFTFHKMSYKIDVYRSDAKVRRNPLDLALYILLFPQLIAGPIIRYYEIADQLVQRTVTREIFAYGVRRFIVGLSKKMIIANTVGYTADQIFALPPNELTTSVAWLGIICYTLQIYFDFSGYSDMAIGLAAMFGFRFPENFNYPYIAQSITEFWRRWHISLSRWFRDYLYIPLGGNRCGAMRTYVNLMTVFFLCGLWHGASWNFVAWGIFHGFFLVVERLGLSRLLDRLPRFSRHIYLVLIVIFGWVLFRAEGLRYGLVYWAALLGFAEGSAERYHVGLYLNNTVILALALGVLGSTPICSWLIARLKNLSGRHVPAMRPALAGVRAAAVVFSYTAMFFVCIVLMAAGTYNPFIYFRF